MERLLQTQFVAHEGQRFVVKTYAASGDPSRWLDSVRAREAWSLPPRVLPARVVRGQAAVRSYIPGVSLHEATAWIRHADDFPGPTVTLWLTEALRALAQLHLPSDDRPERFRHHGGLHPGNLLIGEDGSLWILDWGLSSADLRAPRATAEAAQIEDVLDVARAFLDLYPSDTDIARVLQEILERRDLPATAFERRVMHLVNQGMSIAPRSAAAHWMRHAPRPHEEEEEVDPTVLGPLAAGMLAQEPEDGTAIFEFDTAVQEFDLSGMAGPTDAVVVPSADAELAHSEEIPVPAGRPLNSDPVTSTGDPALSTVALSEIREDSRSSPAGGFVRTPPLALAWLIVAGLPFIAGGLAGWATLGLARAEARARIDLLGERTRIELERPEGPRPERMRILLDAHDGLLRGYPDRVDQALEALEQH